MSLPQAAGLKPLSAARVSSGSRLWALKK